MYSVIRGYNVPNMKEIWKFLKKTNVSVFLDRYQGTEMSATPLALILAWISDHRLEVPAVKETLRRALQRIMAVKPIWWSMRLGKRIRLRGLQKITSPRNVQTPLFLTRSFACI